MKTQTNRIILAILAIALSVIIIFVVAPAVQNNEMEEVTIVVASDNIAQGRLISEENITTKKIARKYLPEGAFTDKEELLGMYAATNISTGFVWLAEKVGVDPAVMAAPFISTIVDVLSLLIYFAFATAVLGL